MNENKRLKQLKHQNYSKNINLVLPQGYSTCCLPCTIFAAVNNDKSNHFAFETVKNYLAV